MIQLPIKLHLQTYKITFIDNFSVIIGRNITIIMGVKFWTFRPHHCPISGKQSNKGPINH